MVAPPSPNQGRSRQRFAELGGSCEPVLGGGQIRQYHEAVTKRSIHRG